MEFKVWVDGIQRLISGVNEETTCRDIVLCLAQATNQFGKFVLIEKWGNKERLLAPNELPLAILAKWTDQAPDVNFIMRRSDHHQQIQQQLQQQMQPYQHQSQPNLTHSQVPQHVSHSTLPHQYLSQQQSHRNQSITSLQPVSHLPSSHSSVTSQHSPAMHQLHPTMRHSPVYGQIQRSSESPLHMPISQFPVCRTKALDNMGHVAATSPGGDSSDGTGQKYRPKRPPPYNEAIAKSSLMQPAALPKDTASSTMSHAYVDQASGDTYGQLMNGRRQMNGIYGDISTAPLAAKSFNGDQKGSVDTYEHLPAHLTRKQDEDRLLKKYKLEKSNHRKEYHQEVHGMSGTYLTSNGSSSQIHRTARSEWNDKEVSKLTSREQSAINDDLEMLQKEKQRIEFEKNQLTFNLNETDSKIAKCRYRIQQLMDEIKHTSLEKENERMRREEEYAKQQLADLKQKIYESVQDYEKASQELNSIQEEMDKLDSDLSDRKKKIEHLTSEIKEANLEGLTLLPLESQNMSPDEENHPPDTLNGAGGDARLNYRLGSTRRISGSPRELGTAVPTSKNPHGVWDFCCAGLTNPLFTFWTKSTYESLVRFLPCVKCLIGDGDKLEPFVTNTSIELRSISIDLHNMPHF